MIPAPDGLPLVGPTARMLGVRVPTDIRPNDQGVVFPGTGGMSVTPDLIWKLPAWRRPQSMGGDSTGPEDHIYGIEENVLSNVSLDVRPDPKKPDQHGFVEPAMPVPLEQYQQALVCSRPFWRQAWPTTA
jgi:hypothetical protein